MYLTPLKPLITTREFTDVWGGLNHNDRISDSEFYDEYGLTADAYPIVKTREAESIITEDSHEARYFAYGSRIYRIIDPGTSGFPPNLKIEYYDESGTTPAWTRITGTMTGLINSGMDVVISGAYVVVFLETFAYEFFGNMHIALRNGYYFNAANEDDDIYHKITPLAVDNTIFGNNGGTLNVTLVDGESLSALNPAPVIIKPDPPSDGAYWLDTTEKVLKKYSAELSMWLSVPTSYTKIEWPTTTGASGFSGIKEGDTVELSGLTFLDSDIKYWYVHAAGDTETGNYIVVTAVPSAIGDQAIGAATVKRDTPQMEHVCASQNRLWGCSSLNHEIYASKLGDPTNWHSFQGVASDSYTATVGSAEAFTGICAMGQRVYMMKENSVVKVYGTLPSNYQITESNTKGCALGSNHSIAQIGEYLYYLASDGVRRFDGFVSVGISDAFGKLVPADGYAFSDTRRYYLQARRGSDTVTYIYDVRYGIWHIWDIAREQTPGGLLLYKNDMYRARIGSSGHVFEKLSNGSGLVPFMAQSGRLMLTLSGRGKASSLSEKYISAIIIRFRLALGSSMDISISYDGGEFTHYKHYEGTDEICKSVLRFPKGRCDYACLKFEGEGEAELISMMKLITLGSEVNHK